MLFRHMASELTGHQPLGLQMLVAHHRPAIGNSFLALCLSRSQQAPRAPVCNDVIRIEKPNIVSARGAQCSVARRIRSAMLDADQPQARVIHIREHFGHRHVVAVINQNEFDIAGLLGQHSGNGLVQPIRTRPPYGHQDADERHAGGFRLMRI
jgi:hypothetical protein